MISATVGLNLSSTSPDIKPSDKKSWTQAWHRFCSYMLPQEASISEAICKAEEAAYKPDEGVEEFAEKLKYTIATSYLLGSSLSISMYEHRREPLAQTKDHIPSLTKVYFIQAPPACHHVSGRIAGSLPVMPMVVITFMLFTYLVVHLPISYCILLSIGLDALTLFSGASDLFSWSPQAISCMLWAPPANHPPFLAVNVPNPVWVVDERIYLQVNILYQTQELVKAAQAMDHSINDALAAVQEVELVSRGYKLSSPLAPISRLEVAAGFQPGGNMPYDRRVRFPLRLLALRKDMVDALEEVAYHCDTALRRLEKHSELGNVHLSRGLATVRQNPRKDKMAVAPSQIPRLLSLPGLSKPTRQQKYKYMLNVLNGEQYSSTSSSPSLLRNDRLDGSPMPDFISHQSARYDRLSLISLRSHFESMHSTRQSLLYALLGLDWDRIHIDSTSETLDTFWQKEMLDEVLFALTNHFWQMTLHMERQVQKHMHVEEPNSEASPVTPPLQNHAGLSEYLTEMGRMLRTIQCKLHVCCEELHLPTPTLHGIQNRSFSCTQSQDMVRSIFDSVREDLLSLSSDWEAGQRIIYGTASPNLPCDTSTIPTSFESVPFIQDGEEESRPPSSPPVTHENVEYLSGAQCPQTFHELLLDSTSPSHLPTPLGQEEVYEGDTSSVTAIFPKSQLTRAERIQLKKQRRASVNINSDSFQPQVMVHELKGVLERRSISMPITRHTESGSL